jgi:hypothetical protein
MSDELGQIVADLSEGQTVDVCVGETEYAGEVIDAKRYKGSKDAIGMIEKGEATVIISLDPDTLEKVDNSKTNLKIHVVEVGHFQWRVPEATLIDPKTEDTVDLGEVTAIEVN